MITRKSKRRVTICLPEDLEKKLRLYQAKILLEEPRSASLSSIISKLLYDSLEQYPRTYYEKFH